MDRIDRLLGEMCHQQDFVTWNREARLREPNQAQLYKAMQHEREDRRDALRQQIADEWRGMYEALEAVEWVPQRDPNWVRCEWCGIVRFKPEQKLTHKPDCQRQAALARARGRKVRDEL